PLARGGRRGAAGAGGGRCRRLLGRLQPGRSLAGEQRRGRTGGRLVAAGGRGQALATVFVVKPFGGPGGGGPGNGVQDQQEFVRTGNECLLLGLSGSDQASVEAPDHWVVARGDQRGHVERG